MGPSAETKKKPIVIRKHSHLEAYHSAWHHLQHLFAVTITCRYSIPKSLRGSTTQDDVVQVFELAIAQTVFEHPLLHVGLIKEDSKKPSWVQLNGVDLSRHLYWQTVEVSESEEEYDARFQKALDSHHDTPFTNLETLPGWRMTLFHRRESQAGGSGEPFVEAVFAWNHANFDGMSGKIFHQTLLKNLNLALANDETITKLTLNDRILNLSTTATAKGQFTPSLHDITKLPLTPGYTIKTAWKELKPVKGLAYGEEPSETKKSTTKKLISWAPPIRTNHYKTHTRRSASLDEPALARVLAKCRAHGVTLTALVHALCLAALVPQFPSGPATPNHFTAGTALNFRRFLKQGPPGYEWLNPATTMANYVSTLDHEMDSALVGEVRDLVAKRSQQEQQTGTQPHDGEDGNPAIVNEGAIWKAAELVKRDLKTRLDRGIKNDPVGLMALVGDWREAHATTAKKPRHYAWTVTNIGVIDGSGGGGSGKDGEDEEEEEQEEQEAEEEPGRWTIERSWFSVGTMVTGAVFMVSPIAVKGKGLFLSMTWQDSIIDADMGDKFFSALDGLLKDFGRE